MTPAPQVAGDAGSGSHAGAGGNGPSRGVPLLLAVVIAGVLVLLDRRLMRADRGALEMELRNLNARLERATDVIPLRLELQASELAAAADAASVKAALRAMGAWREAAARELLPLTGTLPGTGTAWLSLAAEGGTGVFVGQQLRVLPADVEFVLGASVGKGERELARFRPDPAGDAIAAFEMTEPSTALTRVWLKVAPAGKPPGGAPLLFHVREGA